MNILNSVATRIEAPAVSATAPSQQLTNQGPMQNTNEKRAEPEIQQMEDVEGVDLTEGSTDTEAETKAANASGPPAKSKKKIPKKERDAKAGKGQGKANGKEIIKAADKDKEKK